eukprot:2652007-Prymnesium_polylepis.1
MGASAELLDLAPDVLRPAGVIKHQPERLTANGTLHAVPIFNRAPPDTFLAEFTTWWTRWCGII